MTRSVGCVDSWDWVKWEKEWEELNHELERLERLTKLARDIERHGSNTIGSIALEGILDRVRKLRQRKLELEWYILKERDNELFIYRTHPAFEDFRMLDKIRAFHVKEVCKGCHICEALDEKYVVYHLKGGSKVKKVKHRFTTACNLCKGGETYIYKKEKVLYGIYLDENKSFILKPLKDPSDPNVLGKVTKELLKYAPHMAKVHNKIVKYGCPREFAHFFRDFDDDDEDWDPRAPDHFPEDIITWTGEDSEYKDLVVARKHGTESW